MKPNLRGPPKVYIGGKVSQVDLTNGVKSYCSSESQYISEAVKSVEEYGQQKGIKSSQKIDQVPLPNSYSPVLDVNPELMPDKTSNYQLLIGILHWIVELGRIDITFKVSMLSSHVVLPREDHLDWLFYLFLIFKEQAQCNICI